MRTSLSISTLAQYVATQANHFFPDKNGVSSALVQKQLPSVLVWLEKSLAANKNRHFLQDGNVFFNHLNSDQYAMFLYMLSHRIGKEKKHSATAAKFYLLNKALHALDVFYEVELPEIFYFAHPVGTVLGRAKYKNYFVVMQNCTVGNIDSAYPELGEKVVMASQSSVLGASVLGEGVCVGAGSLLIHAKIPAFRTVVGRGKEIVINKARSEKWRNYFRD